MTLSGRGVRAAVAACLGRSGRASRRLLDAVEDLPRVLCFLDGWLRFQVRPDDVFIVSYPRSGTTWMQMILYQLMSDGELCFDHISQVSPWFERTLAQGTHTAASLARLPGPRVFKSHLTPNWLPRGGRVIYVARDGRDVAISYYHLYRSHLGYRGAFDAFFKRFLEGQLQYRSWFDHVAAWQAYSARAAVLWIDYAELKVDLRRSVEKIARFCALDATPARVERAVARSSWGFMKQHQHLFDHATRILLDRGVSPGVFLRRGEIGESRCLTPEQRARFASRQGRRRRKEAGGHLASFLR